MPEARDVLRSGVEHVRPDPGGLQRQEARQRRAMRRRRSGAYVMVVIIMLAVGALGLTKVSSDDTPAGPSSIAPPVATMRPLIVRLDGTVQPLLGIPVNAESLNMSPNGHELVFVADHDGSPQIGTVAIDGSDLRFITQVRSRTIARGLLHGPFTPVWSPDGSRIAFSNGHIFVMNADGSGLTQLTFARGIDQWPSWSPDGETIAYSNSGAARLDANAFSRTQEIWTVPANGGPPTRLTHGGGGSDMPAYSPDGRSIAFTNGGGLFIMGANGRHPHLVAGLTSRVASCPRWSPDGSRLVYLQWAGSYSMDRRPLQRAHIIDLATSAIDLIPGKVVTAHNAVQWLSDDALLQNRFSG